MRANGVGGRDGWATSGQVGVTGHGAGVGVRWAFGLGGMCEAVSLAGAGEPEIRLGTKRNLGGESQSVTLTPSREFAAMALLPYK